MNRFVQQFIKIIRHLYTTIIKKAYLHYQSHTHKLNKVSLWTSSLPCTPIQFDLTIFFTLYSHRSGGEGSLTLCFSHSDTFSTPGALRSTSTTLFQSVTRRSDSILGGLLPTLPYVSFVKRSFSLMELFEGFQLGKHTLSIQVHRYPLGIVCRGYKFVWLVFRTLTNASTHILPESIITHTALHLGIE